MRSLWGSNCTVVFPPLLINAIVSPIPHPVWTCPSSSGCHRLSLLHTHPHTLHIMCTVNGQWCHSVAGRADRCFDADSPGHGPCSGQQGVHHGHWEVIPLPMTVLILLHHFGHRQPFKQPVDQSEKQSEYQHWWARVTLQRRNKGVHPLPSSPRLSLCFFSLVLLRQSYFSSFLSAYRTLLSASLGFGDGWIRTVCTRSVFHYRGLILGICLYKPSLTLQPSTLCFLSRFQRPERLEGYAWRGFPFLLMPTSLFVFTQRLVMLLCAPASARLPEQNE